MVWYDWFARIYDRSLEPLYVEARRAAVEALDLSPASTVLDLPCGTGQSFELIAPRLESGTLVGIDHSEGMLREARRRVGVHAWPHVHLARADVRAVTLDDLSRIVGGSICLDRMLVFLGMTVFPQWESAFVQLWQLLAPGGRMVIVDVHAERPGVQGRLVNLVARADIRRRVWEPLQSVARDFERRPLPSLRRHGGQLFLASGTKPRVA